jgi:hypothetical protein
MIKLPDQFHLLPSLVGRLSHVVLNVRGFHFFERTEDADRGSIHAQFINGPHVRILP